MEAPSKWKTETQGNFVWHIGEGVMVKETFELSLKAGVGDDTEMEEMLGYGETDDIQHLFVTARLGLWVLKISFG
jgi:hypothetical protein